MMCSLKQSYVIGTNGVVSQRRNPFVQLPVLSSISMPKIPNLSAISVAKPLHIASVESLGSLEIGPKRRSLVVKAYDADRSEGEGVVEKAEAARKVKIGFYFATWWFLNVIFNIYNKKVLNAFPFPWLTSTLSLAAGSLIMLISWATKVAEAPNTDVEFWKSLFPVALAHTIGHVAATVSMSKVAVSFTHIIKSGEPAFSVLVSRFILGETFPLPVYLSLVPIIGGCGLAALTELNFNMTGFMGAMISNLAFVFRNIFSKRGMKGKSVSGMNYYACLSLLSLLILTPFAIAVEGPQLWAVGWQKAITEIGPHFIWWVAAQSIFYHLYNQVSYMSLDEISPLTFSIGNTMKRISVIVSSIIIFRTPVQPVNALGAAIAVLGTFLYSQAKQ
ncbi:putative triose phosphate/phosphoenolpyruvate translocator, sugar phosphate transporter [Helianthus annuus]|uniref:Putative triose phosphate/phosphoenolpyruvate translocator n=1 Tax=Helianthus annuus TaxID=4232 RepID=A0A251V8P9_HELAN|nr:glucose-6-phosphate/phosphate translocator 1, chloroplastic [Helianthus annuus]KAF5814983.1 putative triose phosphate/phosphoenolpyruvate translocator, sugar phosphate transporter [Helianthus annuus]KAJ0593533.1 putative triose phosphate/phosphoenolpyruvate translocator, sugar phosphate transporter [Helianthus annuus]KAJ0608548.1 putative triose phosphate/phosphoenolpyruvate translocator, sugar phosphate transporter [Helianthus annuus]KAJ0768614.1 putative triose phosphate/phosphoenolpyruvat